ncbi:hypothetical protein HK105_202945 [Polyrhizophydium stewartii]|uniref:Vacuolar protein sorting-associated protein 51 homolog n=1 Tax=Polyrhizophydium stewartii TaxID=2732419 RepID=A0ABR4NDQ5_9FUNG
MSTPSTPGPRTSSLLSSASSRLPPSLPLSPGGRSPSLNMSDIRSVDSASPLGGSTDLTTPRPARRRRDLLKDYYGLADDSTATQGSENSGFGSEAGSQMLTDSASMLPPRSRDLYPRRADPIDIDAESYHAELAFNKMTKEMTLPELIRKDNQLITEIKDLDGSMKTLVYENYSKFIAATTTIRKMKTNAEEMESQISLLEKKITAITSSAEGVHSALASHRAKIHQLSGVHNLIKKLNFLFELPTKLSECTKKKQYAQAVLFYSKTSALLSHYRHVPIFKQIEDECASIMLDVGRRVRDKMISEKTPVRQISESVGLMLGLGSMPPLELAKEYVYRVSIQMNKLLQTESTALLAMAKTIEAPPSQALMPTTPVSLEAPGKASTTSDLSAPSAASSARPSSASGLAAASVSSATLSVSRDGPSISVSSPKAADGAQQESLAIVDHVAQFNKTFLSELGAFVDCFDAYFLRQREASVMTPSSFTDIDTLKSNLFAKNMSAEDREASRAELMRFVKDMEEKYFALIEKLLQLPDDISRVSPALYVRTLQVICEDISTTQTLRSLTKMDQRVADMSVSILNKIISGVFAKVRQEFSTRWREIRIDPALDVFTVVRQLTGWIKETLIAHALPILENFIQPEATQQIGSNVDAMVSRIRDTMLAFWTDLGNDMLHILILARLAVLWSKGSVESVFSMYSERILSTSTRGSMDSYYAPSHGSSASASTVGQRDRARATPTIAPETDLMAKAQDTAAAYRVTAQRLLTRYAELCVAGITCRIHEYAAGLEQISDGGAAQQVQQVSQVWIDLAALFESVQADLRRSIDEDPALDPRRRSMDGLKRNKSITPGMRPSGSAMMGSGSNSALAAGGGGSASALARHATMRHGPTGSGMLAQGTGSGGGSTGTSTPSGLSLRPAGASGMRYSPSSQLGPHAAAQRLAPERFDSLLNDIDKLFEERIEYLPALVDLNRAAVLNVIAKMAIKCMIESIRMIVLNTTALQQVQVDAAFIRAQFATYVTDERLLASLLDTSMHSAQQRCVDPLALLDSLASLQKRGGVVRARGADEGASRTAADAAATGKPAPCAAPAVVSTPSTLHLVCAAAFVCLLLCLMVLPTLVAMSALWTPWLRLPVCAYLAWALYDLPGASSGAWRGNGAVRDWLLGWPLWEPFRAYFPARLVVTAPVDPNRNYILGFHPHGVYCISLLANIILNPSFTSTIGLRPRIATLPINFVLPVWRDVITHLGVVSVGQDVGGRNEVLTQCAALCPPDN